jgi:AcrR family transcriptional regulator
VNTVHTGDAKRRILAAAQELHEKRGLDAVSMRNVAEAVGVVAAAIYRHYRDKDALIGAMIAAGHGVLETYLREGEKARSDKVLAIMDQFLRFAFDQPGLYELMFLRAHGPLRKYPDDFAAGRSPTFNILHRAVTEEIRRKRYRRDDAMETALSLWAHAHGLISMYTLGRFTLGPDDFAKLYHRDAQRTLRGIKAPSKTKAPTKPKRRRSA